MNLQIGQGVIIEHKMTPNTDIGDWFDDNNNPEGLALIESFDDSFAMVVGCPYPIQLEYVLTYDKETEKWV